MIQQILAHGPNHPSPFNRPKGDQLARLNQSTCRTNGLVYVHSTGERLLSNELAAGWIFHINPAFTAINVLTVDEVLS